jgi:hypothetical protein
MTDHSLPKIRPPREAEPSIITLQVFITTHSPVAVRELSGNQLFVVRERDGQHSAACVGTDNDVQGTIRVHPDALLAPSILVCEGATEVGFMRGTGLQRKASANSPIALVDELEYGLEPHRIIRLVDALGAKEADPPIDQHRVSAGKTALAANGVAVVDGGGTNTFRRANAFLSLGFRTRSGPAATDSFAPTRSVTRPGARRRPRPDEGIVVGGDV